MRVGQTHWRRCKAPRRSSVNRFSFKATAAAIQLRDYQRDSVAKLARAVDARTPTSNRFLVAIATGGGKRLVAAEFIRRHVLPAGHRTLFLTGLGWGLLRQQAETYCQRERGGKARVSFVGGPDAVQEFPGVARGTSGSVVFTTFQTWVKRRESDFRDAHFDVVMIDELHFGEQAIMCDAVLERYRETAYFVGYTGTPRSWSEFTRVADFGFTYLVEHDYLARPVVHPPVQTGVAWQPRTSSARGDVVPSSLRELGASAARNELIVATYVKNAAKFGKTLVFAVDIEHATTLHRMLRSAGVRSGVVHYQQDYATRVATQAAFARSKIDVLVNVQMMTTGVDVPDIRTIFLARPTYSDVLFGQMIGRGSRRTATKQEFAIVDFVDNVQAHGLDLIRPDGFLGNGPPLRCPLIDRHEFQPAALEVIDGWPGYEVLDGLEIVPTQTFGIEFEATGVCRDGTRVEFSRSVAQRILDALRAAGIPAAGTPLDHHSSARAQTGKDNSVWNCEPDPSCGWEITSRILRGRGGFAEIVDACRVLEREFAAIGLRVDHPSVGTHIHLGWSKELDALKQLMIIGAYFEPAVMSLVAPSRARNQYVHSVRNRARKLMSLRTMAAWETYFASHRRKYLAVNPSHLFAGYSSVEVRYHSGTIEPGKILGWVSLWMRVLATATQRDARPGSPYARPRTHPLCAGDRGDVARMCERLGVGPSLRARLLTRRDHVVSTWWARDPRYAQLAMTLLRDWDSAREIAPAPVAERAAE